MNNVMIDLETLGTSANSVVLSVGAVYFDPSTGELGDKTYFVLSTQKQLDLGRTVSASTLAWWMSQSEEAVGVVKESAQEEILTFLLWELNSFLSQEDVKVWGNGAAFDNVILANLYEQVGIETPWKFYNDRCYRTVKNMFPDVSLWEFQGTAHNALDDAIHQAKHLCEIVKQYPTILKDMQ